MVDPVNEGSGTDVGPGIFVRLDKETLYFVDCESADGRSEIFLGSNERYIH